MPIANANGIVVQNAVNGPLSRTEGKVLVDPAGLAQFLTGNRVIFQDLRSGACLSIVDTVTGDITPNVDPLGCNILVAGDDVWAAFGGGTAYRDSRGYRNPGWVPLAVDDVTGTILVLVTNGLSSTINWWDGTTLSAPLYTGAPPGNGVAAAASNGLAVVEFAARPVTFPTQAWPSMPIRDFAMQGGWLVGWNWVYNGLVAWQTGPSPMGYVLAVNVSRFAPGVAVLHNGRVRAVASTGAGQLPGELTIYDIDPVAQTVNGVKVALQDLTQVATPVPVPPTPTPVPPVPVPVPTPQPPAFDEDDSMFTIKASRFRPATGTPFTDRFLVELNDGKSWLSVDDSGNVRTPLKDRTKATDHECWVWTKGSGKASMDFGAHFIERKVDEHG